MATRKQTGFRLIEIPNAKMIILKRLILANVVLGSLIFTDKHKSYCWLSKPTSGFVHRAVNHKRNEFSREAIS